MARHVIEPAVAGRRQDASSSQRLVTVLLLGVVVLQRFAVPVGAAQIPLTLPFVLLVVAFGVSSGALAVSTARLRALVALHLVLALATFAAIADNHPVSSSSLGFVLLLYVVALVVPSHPLDVERLGRWYVHLMVPLALLGLTLFSLQFAGLGYQDYLARVVPARWLESSYNTADPLSYGSSAYRANGVLFLEPSFFALFVGLALVMAIWFRCSLFTVLLLALTAVVPLAGNAFVVILPAIVVIAFSDRRRNLAVFLLPVIALGLVLVTTPLGPLLLRRLGEISASDTSANLRLVEPYQLILPRVADSWLTVLSGHGAGAATELVQTVAPGRAVLTPVVLKLLYEYGAPVLGLFLLLMVACLAKGRGSWRRMPWIPGVLLSYFVVNAALLQVTLTMVLMIFVALVPAAPTPEQHRGGGGRTA